ncbi:hypothetical protein GJ633_05915 [Halorubrum sp. CBA1125]|jgi:hypothetical protein|uniref:hypothetical protein n=1 Tax=Halorubrum sp. CBA1125 TaxID=2668072 RepID=UPI0012E8C687|nr:hypothetical protein [Halorubrum sp. CBA1125]MUW14244.1 hypothetical protein [Halorubrum sp. CBA1125]
MANRRTVLIGLGGLVAGGGAILGTGAFDTVEAERTVSVETTGDADALLGLSPADRDGDGNNAYVDEPDGGTISINLDGNPDQGATGLNQNAITTFRNLVTVTNQGTQTVNSITLEFNTDDTADVDASETFSFPVDETDDDGEDMVGNGDNILTGDGDIPGSLEPGDSVNFGIEIDLIDGGDEGDLPDGDYTLTITAESADN